MVEVAKEVTKPDYLRKILSFRNRFMESNMMHSFIVIHPKNPDPKQVKDGTVNKPSVYDLMGGSEWNNNGRNILVVHKHFKENNQPYNITIEKVKPKHYGQIGEAILNIDWATQRFYEFDLLTNKKHYAYAKEEEVIDPLIPNFQTTSTPF